MFYFQALFGEDEPIFTNSYLSMGWFNHVIQAVPFCLGWFDSRPFQGISHLQFGESFQKVTNGRSWLYQLMVNN